MHIFLKQALHWNLQKGDNLSMLFAVNIAWLDIYYVRAIFEKKKWRNIELETWKKGRGIGDHKTGESKQFLKRKETTKRMLL